MTDRDFLNDPSPLTPWGYWQESLSAWTDFSHKTRKIAVDQLAKRRTKPGATLDADAETLSGELLRTLSALNLRHWQNTSRLLEGLPTWMQTPSNMTGSALVDWFDNLQRARNPLVAPPAAAPEASVQHPEPDLLAPETLQGPSGKADDLTQIKGIGPKLSSRLNELGIYHFKQIADWSDAEARWVDDYLSYKGRVSREKWIKQARGLSANGAATVH